MTLPVCTALMSFVLFFVLHVVIWRLGLNLLQGYAVILILFGLSFVLVSFFMVRKYETSFLDFGMVALAVYSLPMMLYLHFYSGLFRSVSVRVLDHCMKEPSRTISLEALNTVYSARDMVERRVEAMVASGYLVESGGRLVCTGKGALLAQLTMFLARCFGREVTG